MRIAIDARELQGRPTGVGRYLSKLLEHWHTLPEAQSHDLILLRPEGPARGTVWEQWTLPGLVRRAGAHVLFSPAYTAPVLSPVPVVLTVHDVSFCAHPEWFTAREGLRRRLVTRGAAHRAARIITDSEFSRREIVAHLHVPAAKVEVVYLGIAPPTVAAPATGAAGSSERANAILFVGSLFNRRHLPELITAFAMLAARRPGVRLDIVGDNRTTPRVDFGDLARLSGHAAAIGIHSYVTDEVLAGLYSRARAFAFLSDYEGFGFTPLEALASRIPIVVLDSPVAREIYADAAIYVATPEPAGVSTALERALFDDGERTRVLTAAEAVLQRYSWRDAARRTLELLVAHGD